jgi:hypothetical protein
LLRVICGSDSLESEAGDDREMIRGRLVATSARILRDGRRLAWAGVDVLDALHKGVTDEYVVDQLAAAAEHAAEAPLLWDQRSEVPQPRAVALVGLLEPVPITGLRK